MEIIVERKWKKPSYTIGVMSIDGKRFCETLEDTDRGLRDSMSIGQIKSLKKPHITAIPTGVYEVNLNTISPKFGSRSFYKEVCKGKVPRILNVKGFDGILIHAGNKAEDTDGCILVGQNKVVGQVINSQATFRELYKILSNSKDKIIIKIV
nr:MAG TPA: Protein of unknown function (DUF2778) [Crassvirales sp.]